MSNLISHCHALARSRDSPFWMNATLTGSNVDLWWLLFQIDEFRRPHRGNASGASPRGMLAQKKAPLLRGSKTLWDGGNAFRSPAEL